MKTKVKLLRKNATFKKAYPDDSGYDLTACDYEYKGNGLWHILLGVAVEPPEGYYFEVVPRSSFSKTPFIFANNLGVIDMGFRSEWRFPVRHLSYPYWNDSQPTHFIKSFELEIKKHLLNKRIAQAILRRSYDSESEIVQELSKTDRGANGFGSTGL
jgi:dUTP pyrophosphatase